MNTWYFWKSWHPQSRTIYWFLLTVLAALLLYFSYVFFFSPATVIDWQKISNVEKVTVPGERIRSGLFDFSYTFDNYVVTESYQGSDIQVPRWPMIIQLAMVGLSLTVLLVICSALEGFWFYFGTLVFTGILISFQFEQLLLFGESDKFGLITGLAIFLSSLYYFSKIRPELGLDIRFMTFGGLILLFGAFLFLTAEVKYPLAYLVNYGLVAPIILSIIFILILGHVMISFFLKVITRANTISSSNSIWHFLLISSIYLANVFLLHARNAGDINWDILYFNAFFLLVVTTILGIWDFKERETQYASLFPFAPLGAFFYLSLAIICFSTLSYSYAIANDPLTETFEDAIVFSQFSYGLLFTGYVIVNFIQPLMDNMQVYRIMYKPTNFPYGTVQIAGLIAVFAFLLNANMLPFNQAVAGYYNGVADLYRLNDNSFVAEQYYKLGDQYGYNNHRSNYALGALAREQGDGSLAPFYFGEAVKKRPTIYAYVNMGNGLLAKEQFFDALYSYQEGLEAFTDNPYIYNNLAVAYGKTALLDSALLYTSRAAEAPETEEAAITNTLGLIAKNESLFSFNLDSLLAETLENKPYLPGQVNAFLLANKYQNELEKDDFRWLEVEDSTLNSYEFAYLFNYAYNRPRELDSLQLAQLKTYGDLYGSTNVGEGLHLVRAWSLYQQNEVAEAMRLVDGLQARNPFRRAYYNNLLGMWALQQNAPRVAARFFEKVDARRMEGSMLRHAVSLTEASAYKPALRTDALSLWDSIYSLQSEGILDENSSVQKVRDILGSLPTDFSAYEDDFLYQLLRYRYQDLDAKQQSSALKALDDANYRVLALHDLWLQYPAERKRTRAHIDDMLPKADLLNAQGKQYRHWIQLFLWEEQAAWEKIVKQLDEVVVLSPRHALLRDYYQVQFLLSEKRNEDARDALMALAGNPFFEKGFLLALNALYDDPLEQYNLLLKAQETNPSAPELKKAYILSSLRAGLESYAEASLEELQEILDPTAYQAFLDEYRQVREAYTTTF
jgi:hypothetical protein